MHSPVAVDATPGRLEAHQSIGRWSRGPPPIRPCRATHMHWWEGGECFAWPWRMDLLDSFEQD